MSKNISRLICIVLSIMLAISLTACGSKTKDVSAGSKESQSVSSESNTEDKKTDNKDKSKDKSSEPVVLPMLFRNAGNDSGTKLRQKLINDFNEKYKGKYEIKVEWVPGLAAELRAKLKMLNAAGNLPALVTDLAAEPAFGDLLIRNNRLMDLKPYFDASPEWKEMVFEESVAYNTKDGKMYTAPAAFESYVGIFYNKELFQKAGIAEFPKTWDEFWAACDKLKAAGITPISLHTTETGWCTMLMVTSSLALSQEGKDFINQKYPTDFNKPVFVEAMNIAKKLYQYTTPDAVGGNYALAANNFSSGKTAMIPNGPWMIPGLSDPQFAPEGFDKKVGYAHFPGGVMLSWLGLRYGEAVSMDHPLEVREGVVEWIKFNATSEVIKQNALENGNLSHKVKLTDEEKAKLSPVMKEYVNAVETLKDTLIVYQNQWDPISQNETIPKELPLFVTGKLTVEQFVAKLSESGKKYAQEKK